jgi:hypothetical protein
MANYEITPSMKKAGAKILCDYFSESPLMGLLEEDIATEVFSAMRDCEPEVEEEIYLDHPRGD